MRCYDDVGGEHAFARFEAAFDFYNDVYPINANRPFMWKLYDRDTCSGSGNILADLDLAWGMNSKTPEMRWISDLSITYGYHPLFVGMKSCST